MGHGISPGEDSAGSFDSDLPDGFLSSGVLVACTDSSLNVLSLAEPSYSSLCFQHPTEIDAFPRAISHLGDSVVSLSFSLSGGVCFYDLRQQKNLGQFRPGISPTTSTFLSSSSSSGILALGASFGDNSIHVWSMNGEENPSFRFQLSGHRAGLVTLNSRANIWTNRILSGAKDTIGPGRVWDIETAKEIGVLRAPDLGWVVGLDVDSEGGRVVAAASIDRPVSLWDATNSFRQTNKSAPATHSIRGMVWPQERQNCIIVGSDEGILVFDPRKLGEPVLLTETRFGNLRSVIEIDETRFATVYHNRKVCLWSCLEDERLHQWELSGDEVGHQPMCYIPSGRH